MMQRWIQTWKLLALTYPDQIHPGLLHQYRCKGTDELFDLLAAAYSERPRQYHCVNHLQECFHFYDSLPRLSGKTARTEMALWFHDSVYKIVPRGNEEESANLCLQSLMDVGMLEDLAMDTANIILADHGVVLANPEQQVLSEVDLWILASPPERFREYEVQIRNEYKEVPDEVFYPTRARIMKRFAEKEHIYYTPEIRVQLEDRAKANLSKYST
jgi:predicted metal-dependent HD superfamily phosphohydrolase